MRGYCKPYDYDLGNTVIVVEHDEEAILGCGLWSI